MKRYFAFAFAVLSLVACRRTAEPEMVPGLLTVEPIITKATEVNFEDGDKIGLTVSVEDAVGNYADNHLMTYSGSAFSGDLEWYADIYAKSDIYAYYPYSSSGTPTSYSCVADQSAGIGAADFMVASKTGVMPSYNAVTMVFKHLMTKLVINVDNQSGAEIEGVGVAGTPVAADIDVVSGTVSASAGITTDPVKAYEAVAGTTWQAIVIPHSKAMSIVVTLSNKKVISQSLAAMALKSGGQYTINVRLLADEAEVSASGEIQNWTDEGEIGLEGDTSSEDLPVTFNEYSGYFEYDGVRYNTVTLDDGNTWMAENLRFIPRGRTVSSNPVEDAGIWYPAANADKVAEPDLAATLGLLYDAATAFGVDKITIDNADTFEGCQGICPPGWHIPTVAEMTGLVGHCSNSALVNADGAYYDSAIKGASLAALEEDGFSWQFASMRNKANTAGNGSYSVTNYNGIYGVMSYLIGSTMYQTTTNTDGSLKNVQYYYMMPTYNASNEKVTVAYGNFLAGASLRCLKNK